MYIIRKVYEKKIQNDNNQTNKSSMQTAGKKNRSTVENLIIMNSINKKAKIRPYKYLYIECRCRKMLWQTLVQI